MLDSKTSDFSSQAGWMLWSWNFSLCSSFSRSCSHHWQSVSVFAIQLSFNDSHQVWVEGISLFSSHLFILHCFYSSLLQHSSSLLLTHTPIQLGNGNELAIVSTWEFSVSTWMWFCLAHSLFSLSLLSSSSCADSITPVMVHGKVSFTVSMMATTATSTLTISIQQLQV